MSQELTPWISDTILAQWNCRYGEQKAGGRRFQIIEVENEPEPSSYGVGCKVSDKVHYIHCALSKKAMAKFEKQRSSGGANTRRLRNTIIQVQKYALKVYNPGSSKQNYSQAPTIVTRSGKPQFWFYITRFVCLGDIGSSVFGEPAAAMICPEIRTRLEQFLDSQRKRHAQPRPETDAGNLSQAKRLCCSPTSRIPLSLENPPSALFKPAPETDEEGPAASQTDYRAAPPTIAGTPFLNNMEACWNHESLWQALRIQQLCIPAMPFAGPTTRALSPPADLRFAVPMSVSNKVPTESRGMSKNSKYMGLDADAEASAGAVKQAPQQRIMSAVLHAGGPNGVPMACSGADDLYGVLRDSSAQLMPSEAIMNQIYGSAGSVDGPADDMSQQIASSELYRQRVGWDHGPAFSIAE